MGGFRKVTVDETLDGGTEPYWILIILGFLFLVILGRLMCRMLFHH
jgi:hypothetical protein